MCDQIARSLPAPASRSFVVLQGASKTAMEDLTIELCRTKLPADKARGAVGHGVEMAWLCEHGLPSSYVRF
jgi:hypothetical protein